MKYFLSFFFILLLSSCTLEKTSHPELERLKQEISRLQVENANLREENNLLRAGGDPRTITTGYSTGPSEFVEGNFASCIQEAESEYIRLGSEKCRELGYSHEEILANKCQLDTPVIENLKKTRQEAEKQCHILYQ